MFALRVLYTCCVSLPEIDKSIELASGVVVPDQVANLRRLREDMFELRHVGEFVASIWAAQALWRAASHVNEMTATLKDRKLGKKFRGGRKIGTKGLVRKAIAAHLKTHPTSKNDEIWTALSKKPPRGWEFFDNRVGRYISGPENHNIDLRRFQNICADERRALITPNSRISEPVKPD